MTAVKTVKTMKNTVLVIDDEPLIQDIAAMMIENVSYDVLVAGDGLAGIQLVEKHRQEIFLVLCDVTMAGMDGWQTTLALQKLAPELPIVLISGQIIDQATCDRHLVQPWATMQKPFIFQTFKNLLQRAQNAAPLSDTL
jgi:two-component system, cell cycle sensor histidine kinase and response regulator CckA